MFKDYKQVLTSNAFDIVARFIIRNFPGIVLERDNEIRFHMELIPDLRTGERDWTIRFKPGTVRLPANPMLPVIETMWDNPNYRESVGYISIKGVCVGHVRDWPARHASIFGSGWSNKKHMTEGISDIYEPIYHQRLEPDTVIQAYYHVGFVPTRK